MKNLQIIVVKSGNKISKIDTENYFLESDGKPKSQIKNFVNHYFSLSSDEISSLQEKLSELHCQHEMNFQKKEASGSYGEIVSTPFFGFAPIPHKSVKKLVESTGPILREMRTLLQKLMGGNFETAFKDYPDEVQKTMYKILDENIYWEKNYIHPNLKDYPFLSVVGFDAAIFNTDNPEEVFFEINAGTPCGIEDQYQLFHHFKNNFPDFFNQIEKQLPLDNTHELLKETIDSCAMEWTGMKNGISVILSPGPYNPAHPEIAALAVHSGMPLVRMEDLYIDEKGNVRLEVIDEEDPIVTGIYNRKEESFLLFSRKYQIPLRSPSIMDTNKKLNEKFNYGLELPVLYNYFYGTTGIEDLILDEKQKPVYQELFEKISPASGESESGDLIEAVWNKKLFVSNLGGRVLDDKRLFRFLADKVGRGAHPSKEVMLGELKEKIQSTVIKAPDLSGGTGVMVGPELSDSEREEAFNLVQKNPSYYELQEFLKLSVIPTVLDGDYKPLPVDWRLMVMFNGKGKVDMGPHGCLVRSAPYGSMKTNTSAGGGYAIGLVYDDTGTTEQPILPLVSRKLPKKKMDLTWQFLENLKSIDSDTSEQTLENLTWSFRDVMDIIGIDKILFIHELRKLRDKKTSYPLFDAARRSFLADLKKMKNFKDLSL